MPYIVTAVVKDPPRNTNLPFDTIIWHDMLISFSEMPEDEQWSTFIMDVYAKFNHKTDMADIAKQLSGLTTQLSTNLDIEMRIMPVSDIRHKLKSDTPFTMNFINLFLTADILLLFAAVFNFLNLHLDLF